MPYSVRDRNDKHRQDLADELVLLGVDPFTARQVAIWLPGGWTKKLCGELRAINESLRIRTQPAVMNHHGRTGTHGGPRETCGFCIADDANRCVHVAESAKKEDR